MSAHAIDHLLHDYGCALVFAAVGLQALGAPLPGTTVLIAAALIAASDHGLPIAGVIAAGVAGVLAGTSIGFAVGRWGGPRLLDAAARRFGHTPAQLARIRLELAGHGAGWLFAARFITGLRNVAGLIAGISGMTGKRFLTVTIAAALTWALLNGLGYYWFGRALAGADTWVTVVLVGLGLVWTAVSVRLVGRGAMRRLRAGASAGLEAADRG